MQSVPNDKYGSSTKLQQITPMSVIDLSYIDYTDYMAYIDIDLHIIVNDYRHCILNTARSFNTKCSLMLKR